METSVFRIDGLPPDDAWALVRDAKPDLIGRADLLASDVGRTTLRLDCDPPPSRHANIAGWKVGSGELEKAARKSDAQVLAAAAKYFSLPS